MAAARPKLTAKVPAGAPHVPAPVWNSAARLVPALLSPLYPLFQAPLPLPQLISVLALRVRNELGGFFGTGTSVDVRQLTLRGTIYDKIRYQVGDMFLRQTRFTLFNSPSDAEVFSAGFKPYRDVIDYENF